MTPRAALARLLQQADLNFFLTNCLPRRSLTLLMGWFSKIKLPWVRDASIAIWHFFSNPDLSDARDEDYRCLHDCFTRRLRDGARAVDPDPSVLVSPCDGIVGGMGIVSEAMALQAKGSRYPLIELLGDAALARYYEGGQYVTLRLTAGMYHRFHAPHDCRVEQVTYIAGDTWNVNPAALARVARLYCRNERAIVRCRLDGSGKLLTLVPIAAILVASIRLQFLDLLLHLRYAGPSVIPCNARLVKGEEMGWFEHGSTIIVFAPADLSLCAPVIEGSPIRMGQALLRTSAPA